MTSATATKPTRPETPPGEKEPRHYGMAKGVFYPSAAIIIVAVLFSVLLPDQFNTVVSTINSTIVASVGWYYILAATFFVAAAAVLAFSRLGSIKLGKDDEEPQYSLMSWFAMLFAAGMGIGLVFWGLLNLSPSSHQTRRRTSRSFPMRPARLRLWRRCSFTGACTRGASTSS